MQDPNHDANNGPHTEGSGVFLPWKQKKKREGKWGPSSLEGISRGVLQGEVLVRRKEMLWDRYAVVCFVITVSSWLSHRTRLHRFTLYQIWNLGLALALHSLTVAIPTSCSFSFEGLSSSHIMPPPSDFFFPSLLLVLEGRSSPVHSTLISSDNISQVFPGPPVWLAQWEILDTHLFGSFHPHEGGVVIPAVYM